MPGPRSGDTRRIDGKLYTFRQSTPSAKIKNIWRRNLKREGKNYYRIRKGPLPFKFATAPKAKFMWELWIGANREGVRSAMAHAKASRAKGRIRMGVRRIGGRVYRKRSFYRSKRAAQTESRRLQRQGSRVRVYKTKHGWHLFVGGRR